jgi:hypothetical protein
MAASEQQEVVQMLQNDWELQLPELVSEQEILEQLEKRVIQLADRDPEAFFQLMYRLDVPEQKLRAGLLEQDAPMQIAKLIYKRQLQKIEARKMFRSKPPDIEDELKW